MSASVQPDIQSSLKTNIQAIALDLCTMMGAKACYLAIRERPAAPPRFIGAASVQGDPPDWNEIGGDRLLRRIGHNSVLSIEEQSCHALLLTLPISGRDLGAAILLFDNEPPPISDAVVAAARLAGLTLGSVWQLAALHDQAEQMVERTRLREIQLSRNLIRGVIDSVPMGLVLIDPAGYVLAANRALAGRFGLEPAMLVGRFYGDVLGEWSESAAARTFATRQQQRLRRTLQRPGGGEALIEIASIPLFDTSGAAHQAVEVWEDITERVALQTQLVRAEKLAAIGHLAASIAHEVGNPLQAIQGFLALFLEQCPPETPNQHFLRLAEEEIERIVRVLERLRDLYRPRADVFTNVNINELIESVLLLTSKQLERSRIRVLRELDPDLPAVRGVADQLKQVLLNLVLNAAEAMPNGGTLHVQTYRHHLVDGRETIAIAITDTGVGIPPDQLTRIFDGLHTTKERGMGLGLYTSKAIVERHLGRISAQSIPGEGTTFEVVLPIRHEEIRHETTGENPGR
ncbi:MAG: ATP-binding protein [Roseiflexaceae bacterium]|nr:ATP-binding protein [Roseiflexus sp.]MDW8145943.1 ATP-binding protein [Roseiflexaceae bacterium]MDW8232596.1 ATP-binding protein [Roseiflexaceae bacterium]